MLLHQPPNLMELEADKKQLEDQKVFIEQYLEHPITREAFRDLDEAQERAVSMICDIPITNLETFFAHFQARGELIGLRRTKASLLQGLEEVKDKIKELK